MSSIGIQRWLFLLSVVSAWHKLTVPETEFRSTTSYFMLAIVVSMKLEYDVVPQLKLIRKNSEQTQVKYDTVNCFRLWKIAISSTPSRQFDSFNVNNIVLAKSQFIIATRDGSDVDCTKIHQKKFVQDHIGLLVSNDANPIGHDAVKLCAERT